MSSSVTGRIFMALYVLARSKRSRTEQVIQNTDWQISFSDPKYFYLWAWSPHSLLVQYIFKGEQMKSQEHILQKIYNGMFL